MTITFNGAESALALWLNGHFVGYAEDTFTPSEFDLTPYLVPGENKLAAQVFKWCSGSWLEDQDFFRFSGLFRSVVLRTYPKVHLFNMKVGVDLPEDLENALVKVDLDLEGAGSAKVRLDGVGELEQDPDGQFRVVIPEPELWSSEEPNLYRGMIEVADQDGRTLEFIPFHVGVRRFGIEDGLLKINGERVVFVGVNRHEFGLDGRVMTREQTEADMIALKQAGLNSIRTSHYPNNSFFYELADEYGFYVIDEMNLESHGLWDRIRYSDVSVEEAVPGNDPVWLPLLLDRATNMYQRDKNHPSIVMWSCGNGIYFADHSPTPRIQEVKYLYQGIRGSVENGEITIQNRYNFTNTSQFECVVTLREQELILEAAILETDVAPGETETYKVPFEIPEKPGEYVIDVSFQLREGTPYADAGFEVAHEQGVVIVEPAQDDAAEPVAPEVVHGIHNIGVHGPNFSALFSRLHGGLLSYKYGITSNRGNELLKAVPVANFWHAPTSNERGWNSSFEDGQWLLASRYAKTEWSPDNPRFEMRGNLAVITYQYDLPTIPVSKCTVEYAVDGEGRIEVTETLEPAEGLPDLPEFGMLFKADTDLSVLTWYGEGPDESYVDRRGGARLGVYQQAVEDQVTEYLRPQESGSHTGVRWAEVTDEKGRGLRFEAPVPMEFAAQPWSPFEIENAAYHVELPPIQNTFIRPALARRGVAGDDTWGSRPHKEYLIPAEPMVFRFSFQGIM